MKAPESSIHHMVEEDLLEQAQEFVKREDWRQAIAVLDPHWRAGKLSMECLGLLAYSYSQHKQYDTAISIYRELCKGQPHEARWFYCLGYQYEAKRNFIDAAEAYEKCLELYPCWLKAILRLGKTYESMDNPEKALNWYREGISRYKEMKQESQKDLVSIYLRICLRAGKILSQKTIDQSGVKEAEDLFRECATLEPQNADNWYRLGCLLLDIGKIDQALEFLRKAEVLAPKKEYISHKIAQALLKKEDVEGALKVYETIPSYRRTPYILHGIADCLVKKGQAKKAAQYLHQAVQKEPEKFYHHRDFGFVLIKLGDRDQATKELEKANQLFKEEHGRDYNKVLAKIEEIKNLPPGERVVFEEPPPAVAALCFGTIISYNGDRGFGFIKNDSGGPNVFFHIKHVRGSAKPRSGARVKFVSEMNEKGPQAAKVWLL